MGTFDDQVLKALSERHQLSWLKEADIFPPDRQGRGAQQKLDS